MNITATIPAMTAEIDISSSTVSQALVLDSNLQAGCATTQYIDFPVNSMAVVHGKVLCASENGLYEFTGGPVYAFFELPALDIGTRNSKRLRYIYLSVEASEDLTVKLTTELGLEETITVPIDQPGQHSCRIVVSRAIYGNFWTIRVGNDDNGGDFSVDEISILPVVLTHGKVRA